MAIFKSIWTLLYLLALATMGFSLEPAPATAVNIYNALEVTNRVVTEMVQNTLPPTENYIDVLKAMKQMCPLVQYNYEVKELISSEPEVSTATQAMDILLDSIVIESCDWLSSIIPPNQPDINCTIDYLSIICAELDLKYAVSDLSELLSDLYENKELSPSGVYAEPKLWISTTFSGQDPTDQASVLSILKQVDSYNSCSENAGAISCD